MTNKYLGDRASLSMEVGSLATATRWVYLDSTRAADPLLYLEAELDLSSSTMFGFYTSSPGLIDVANNEVYPSSGWVAFHQDSANLVLYANGVSNVIGSYPRLRGPLLQVILDRTGYIYLGKDNLFEGPIQFAYSGTGFVDGTPLIPFAAVSNTLWTGLAGAIPTGSVVLRTSPMRFMSVVPATVINTTAQVQLTVSVVDFDSGSTNLPWVPPPPPPPPPEFQLSFTYTTNGLNIVLTNTSNRQNEYSSVFWLVDGVAVSSDGPVVNYTFPAAGTYEVVFGGRTQDYVVRFSAPELITVTL